MAGGGEGPEAASRGRVGDKVVPGLEEARDLFCWGKARSRTPRWPPALHSLRPSLPPLYG